MDLEPQLVTATIRNRSTPSASVPQSQDEDNKSLLNTSDHILYLIGYPDDSFGPNRDMTRAEVAVMFYRLLADPEAATKRVYFSDVRSDAWYGNEIEVLAGLGIVNGYPDGTYRPDDPITRAEFTAIAMRFAELVPEGDNVFSDVSQDSWYYGLIVGATQYGWISGYPDGTFRPDDKISRAEVAKITNKLLERSADEDFLKANPDDLTHFTDIAEKDWYYNDVMETATAHDYDKSSGKEIWTATKK
jgi:hypothetical protein